MDKMRQFLTILLTVCAISVFGAVEPKVPQELALSVGWNLVALEGESVNPTQFLELKPWIYDENSKSYIQCTPETDLSRGMAFWIYSAEAKTVKLALRVGSATAPDAQPTPDTWSLVGAANETPSWLEQVTRLFQWDARKGYVPTTKPVKGQGYWAK